jgi:hypothetical protein
MSTTPTNVASRPAGSPRLPRQQPEASRLAEVVDTAESPAKESSTIESPTTSAPSASGAQATLEPDSAAGSDAPGGDRSLIRYAGSTLELKVVPATAGAPGVEISKLLTTIGVIALDPGFTNTGSTTSAVTYIDGDAGILRYRGYPIEQLAQSSTFIETSHLLIHGELPAAAARRVHPTPQPAPFWFSPPPCAVAEPHRAHTGETVSRSSCRTSTGTSGSSR